MLRKKYLLPIVITALLSVCSMHPESFCKEGNLEERLRVIEQEMITDGKYLDAIGKLTTMLESRPRDSRIYMNLGIARYGLMEYKKAYEYLKKSKNVGPKREFKDLLYYAISKIDDNRDALREIEEAKDAFKEGEEPDSIIKEKIALSHFEVLQALLKEKYYYPAIVTTHIIWLKNNAPHYPGIYRLSADVYYQAMIYPKAVEDYKKAIEDNPEDSLLHQTLADCLVAMGDFDSAQEYYDEAIDLYKKEGLKDNNPKISKLRKIQKALPKKYKDISDLIKARCYEEAEDICKKRISLNPGDYAAISQLGEIYWKKDDRKGAIKLFKKVVKVVPDYPIAHFLLGKGYFFQQKHQEAIKEFKTFKEKMELLPKMDGDTINYYVSALHGISCMYSSLKRYDMMAKECQKIINLKPDDQIAHFNLAICYYNHYHNRSAAYNELKKVIEIDYATDIADQAKFFIDYIQRNPDSRFVSDFSFIFEDN